MTVIELIEALSELNQKGHGASPVLVPGMSIGDWVEVDAPAVTTTDDDGSIVLLGTVTPEAAAPTDALLRAIAHVEAKYPEECKDNQVWKDNVARLIGR